MFFKILKEKKKKRREKIGRRDIRKHNCKRRKKLQPFRKCLLTPSPLIFLFCKQDVYLNAFLCSIYLAF